MRQKTTLLLLAALLVSGSSFATNYFIKPTASGDGDGTSWENALAFDTWYKRLNYFNKEEANDGYADGDCFYFAGGTYTIPSVTVSTEKNKDKGFTLIGGYNPELTGTETAEPTDFTTHRTIFNGDRTSLSASNARCILAFQLNTTHLAGTRSLLIQGIEFCNALYPQNAATPSNGESNSVRRGALCIDNSGDVTIKNCKFYDNKIQKDHTAAGGAALLNFRSTIHVIDCEFTGNQCASRGGAIRVTSENTGKGYLTLERCLIANNSVTSGTGSAILVQSATELNIVNTTITGNTANTNGAIYVNGGTNEYPNHVNIVNSTIANNANAEIQYPNTNSNTLKLVNSIIANRADKTSIVRNGSGSGSLSIVSSGYCVLGKINLNSGGTYSAGTSDNQNDANLATAVFSSTELTDGVLIPKAGYAGATDVATIVSSWENFWTKDKVNLNVDQTNVARSGNTPPGAYAQAVTKAVEKYGWASYVTPFAAEFPEGRAYVVTSAGVTNGVQVEAVTQVPAQTPVLLKEEGDVLVKVSHETVAALATNLLSVGEATTPDGKYAYVLAKNGDQAGFKQWTGEASTLEGRVVLLLDETVAAARSFLGFNEGEPTALSELSTAATETHQLFYDLQGRRVAQPTKGLYIVNGKKVIIK